MKMPRPCLGRIDDVHGKELYGLDEDDIQSLQFEDRTIQAFIAAYPLLSCGERNVMSTVVLVPAGLPMATGLFCTLMSECPGFQCVGQAMTRLRDGILDHSRLDIRLHQSANVPGFEEASY
jgi:hypothetical protein